MPSHNFETTSEICNASMSSMFNLGDVLELIIDGFNDSNISGHNV
ncbi:MAG: hypothetical protein DDT25_01035 [Chloroflexi bacterium]|nr:hypothetical protein [Chloroflexota bacterium]